MSDAESIELTGLCGTLADGAITGAQQERLNAVLKSSAEARQFYVRHAALSASLSSYAAELLSDAPPVVVKARRPRLVWWHGVLGAAAAVIVAAAWWVHRDAPPVQEDANLVALITGTKNCIWSGPTVELGATLRAGQRLDLTEGLAEITFDSGARVMIEGPAALQITSAWMASVDRGTARACVPEQAIGFRIARPALEVVDPGTEFSILADASAAEVLVLKGAVEAAGQTDARSLVLKQQDSRRFAADGVTDVRDRERKFARLAKVFQLDHTVTAGDYAHWTFDESNGSVLVAEGRNKKKGFIHAKVDSDYPATLIEGRWNKGLVFDGRLVAKATVPGMSAPGAARTLAFWVRVPEDASPKGGGTSILGWGQRSKKRAAQSARIGWNKSPAQGPVGAIRTELGRTLVMGSTNVRDGRWHHVAVVFLPDANGSLQAKQYVDGRLDGGTTTEAGGARMADAVKLDAMDALWLGRSPSDRSKEGGFTGVLDELFVIDHALSPAEIVNLMRENQPEPAIVSSS